MSGDLRPRLELTINNAGQAFIGVTEFDQATGYGLRSYTLSTSHNYTHPRMMRRRFDDMARLMGDAVNPVVDPLFDEVLAIAPPVLTGENREQYEFQVRQVWRRSIEEAQAA